MSFNIKYMIGLAILVLCASSTMDAQTRAFEQTFGGLQEDRAFDLAAAPNGGVIHIGYSYSLGNLAKSPNAHLVLSDAHGTATFEAVYDVRIAAAVDDPQMSVFLCANGDIVWTSAVEVLLGGPTDIIVVRVNSSGGLVWCNYIGTINSANDYSTSIIESSTGDIYITGYTEASGGAGNTDALVVKYDASGTMQWANLYGGTGDDYGHCIRESSIGNLVIAGGSDSWSSSSDGLQFCVSPAGAIVWTGVYGTSSNWESLYSLVENTNGDLYAAGASWVSSNSDVFVVRSSAGSGGITQAATYSAATSGKEEAWHIAKSKASGNLVLTGRVPGIIGGTDGFFLEVGPAFGSSVNYRVLGTTGEDDLRALVYSPGASAPYTADGYWMIGRTNGSGAGSYDHYMLRSNLRGKTGCGMITTTSDAAASGYSSPTVSKNSYQVAQVNANLASVSANSSFQMCSVGYYQPQALKSGAPNLEASAGESLFVSLEVLPQPVQSGEQLQLNAGLERAATLTISISDLQGREVFSTRFNAQAGNNQFKINPADLNSGLYVLQVSGLGQTESLPVMLVD